MFTARTARGTVAAKKRPPPCAGKVIEAIDKKDLSINIWGTGEQTRSFMYIDDCVKGIDMITHCDDLIPRRRSTSVPANLSPSIRSFSRWKKSPV